MTDGAKRAGWIALFGQKHTEKNTQRETQQVEAVEVMSFSSIWNAHNRTIVASIGVLVIVVGLVAVASRVEPPIDGQGFETLSALPAQDVQPSFEIVRINKNGSAVFSGSANPGATINLKLNGEHLASIDVDIDGDWLYTSGRALQPGQHVMRIRATLKGFADSHTDEVLLVDLPSIDPQSEDPLPNETAVVFAASSERGMRVLQRKNFVSSVAILPEIDQHQVVITEPEIKEVVDAVPAKNLEQEPEVIRVQSETKPLAEIGIKRILLEPDDDAIIVEGKAEPVGMLRGELEGTPAREALIDAEGDWRMTFPATALEGGGRQLLIEQLQDGQVRARRTIELDIPTQLVGKKEVPATKTKPVKISSTKRTVKVKKGDSLWTIAKRVYGDSKKYSKILKANKDQIGSHKDLKPGMVLKVPE